MKVLKSIQAHEINDAVRSKFSMASPVLQAILLSLKRERIDRLGGLENITLADLAREYREGNGDTGICFEYAVHQSIANKSPVIYPLISTVIEDFCGIPNGADSILFGPEKEGVIPILETVNNSLTDESRIYVGNAGRPPKLKKYIPQIIRAFRRSEERNKLPRTINGLWKADLFVGNTATEKWVGTSVKINETQLQGAQGLRIGIYPKANRRDYPRKDDNLNLIRLPLPYDSDFMELFYKTFFLVKAFLKADALLPPPVALPDAEDRLVVSELSSRREFPVLAVLGVINDMAQVDLLETLDVQELTPDAGLSEERGLVEYPQDIPSSDLMSLTPVSLEHLE